MAAFSGSPLSGTAPVTVSFTDASTGSPTSYAWDFDNDGSVDSTQANPQFTYTAPGSYSVKLTVTNATGSDSLLKTGYVSVGSSPPPPSGTQTLTPIADAQVKSTSPTTNYGTLSSLRVRQGTSTSPGDYHSYLKFDVSGLSAPAAAARLRLWVTDPSPDGGRVFAVASAWSESTITWANAPAIGTGSLASAGPRPPARGSSST